MLVRSESHPQIRACFMMPSLGTTELMNATCMQRERKNEYERARLFDVMRRCSGSCIQRSLSVRVPMPCHNAIILPPSRTDSKGWLAAGSGRSSMRSFATVVLLALHGSGPCGTPRRAGIGKARVGSAFHLRRRTHGRPWRKLFEKATLHTCHLRPFSRSLSSHLSGTPCAWSLGAFCPLPLLSAHEGILLADPFSLAMALPRHRSWKSALMYR